MKNRRLRSNMLVLCLVVALLISQVLQPMVASAADDSPVFTLPDLLDAIDNAQDGDTIKILSGMDITNEVVIGDPNKRITIEREDNMSRFLVKGNNVLFQNIVFDGKDMKSLQPFAHIITNGISVTFENCIFKNFYSANSGGAILINAGRTTFRNCQFENNRASSSGGHISIYSGANTAVLNIENCIMVTGEATEMGGAIANFCYSATCNIDSSIITGNSTGNYGGGVFNKGIMNISNTKLYDNTTDFAGADIGNSGQLTLEDTLEELLALFHDEGIAPTGWMNDYDEEAGSLLPGIDPSFPYSLLKLEYALLPTEVVLDEASLGTADDGKVTGLESGKYYKVTAGEVVSYSKADGTLTTTESDASPLVGTEITGLTNGETYLIEEFTPAPTTVLLDSASLGTADNEKVIGLAAGKMYKVSIDGITNYTKADGTLTINADEAEALTGTEIVGLTNGETYLVEEYTPPTPEPEPEEPIEEPVDDPDPSEEEPIEEPDPNDDQDEEPIEEPTPDPEPVDDDQEDENPTPTPTPTPTPKPNSGSGGSSNSSYPVVTAPKAVVLSSGKAVIDTTKTEYLLGYSDGLLGNQNTVTRSQFTQIMYRLLTPESLEAVYSEKNTFKDVASDAWYNEAVSSLANAGLILVGTDKLFNPDKNITWGEMCSILSKFAKPNSEWKIITRHWAKDAINTAISYRWFEYNDQFNPDGEVTRLEMLKFISTMFDWTTK